MTSISAPNVDPADLARFEKLGAQWWSLNGPMRQLHKLNPVRLGFIRDEACRHFGERDARRPLPLAGLTALDIGCGGGILSEPLARLGAKVTGVDPGASNIGAAQAHAQAAGLAIAYRAATAEALASEGEGFDIVLAMEVIEHVADPARFVKTAATLVKPEGLLFASTLNRTLKSFALAIVGAEYVLGWLPRGTHDWRQFVTPREFARQLRAAGLQIDRQTGVAYNPFQDAWEKSPDMDVNYMLSARRG